MPIVVSLHRIFSLDTWGRSDGATDLSAELTSQKIPKILPTIDPDLFHDDKTAKSILIFH